MKKLKDPTLVIYGACTVIWTLLALSKFLQRSEDDSLLIPLLFTLCALLWLVTFVARWRTNRSKQQDTPTKKE